MPLKRSPTQLVVGGVISIFLIIMVFYMWGARAALILTGLFAYEIWTFINEWPNDTISEIMVKMSERPLVPFLFAYALAWFTALGTFGEPLAVLRGTFLGGFCGHFFWQFHKTRSR